MNKRSRASLGMTLIFLGLVVLLNQLIQNVWPLIIMGLGAALIISAIINRPFGLAVAGSILLVIGAILFYQSNSGDWNSWYYLWPLVPGSAGMGMLLTGWLKGINRKGQIVAWVFVVSSLIFTALCWNWQRGSAQPLSWAVIPVGIGVMFLLAGFISRAGGLTIPGTILSVVGLLLYWQNAANAWDTWSYVWALIPASLGLGFVLATLSGLKSRALAIVGIYFILISLLFFFIFAAFFAQDWTFLRYWPVLIIVLGGVMLATGLRRKA